jgi:hypothetical protein
LVNTEIDLPDLEALAEAGAPGAEPVVDPYEADRIPSLAQPDIVVIFTDDYNSCQ